LYTYANAGLVSAGLQHGQEEQLCQQRSKEAQQVAFEVLF